MKQDNMVIHGTYAITVTGYDWGCGVNKVMLTFNKPIDSIKSEDILVTETKQITDFSKPDFPIKEVSIDRKIIDAYLSNKDGIPTLEPSPYVVLTLYVSPDEGSPLLFNMNTQFNTWSVPYGLHFTLAKDVTLISEKNTYNKIIIDSNYTKKVTSADHFKVDTFISSNQTTYDYAYYIPPVDSDTLVIWLHGMGEGANDVASPTDLYVTLLANKVTALIDDEFQKKVGPAHILVPKCPTYRMDKDDTMSNFTGETIIADDISYYQTSLHELICFYQKKVNAKKTVLMGCSNGGYMTLLMAINYPDQYDAIVPICEALPDKSISDEQIKAIKDLPMFFIYSLDDQVVDPSIHEIPTIARLKDIKATNLHVSTSKHVVDTSGNYKDKDNNPYQYNGHWSWIYFYNNEALCDDTKIPVFTWIKKQIK